MTYDNLINNTNELSFMKENNLVINKIKFEGKKDGSNRRITIYFNKHKWPCWVGVDYQFSKMTQAGPVYCTGIGPDDKDYWSYDIRVKLLKYMYERFWVWLKRIDLLYDVMVLGHTKNKYDIFRTNPWSPEIFAGLIDDGFDIHYWVYKDNLYKYWDFFEGPKNHIINYNEDVDDNLYPKCFGKIVYPEHKRNHLDKNQAYNNEMRMGF